MGGLNEVKDKPARARSRAFTRSQVGSREPFNTHLSAPVWSVRAEPLQGLSNPASPLAPLKLNARLYSRGTTSLWILLQLVALFQTSLELLPDFVLDWILNFFFKLKKKLLIHVLPVEQCKSDKNAPSVIKVVAAGALYRSAKAFCSCPA